MNKTIFNKRRAGFLVPVYALRRENDFGIGDTAAVHEAIDFCAKVGFEVLQLLPLHETIGDHSPYSPVSSYALAPGLLTITQDQVPGLTEEMVSRLAPESWLGELRKGKVSQDVVLPLKTRILLEAGEAFIGSGKSTALGKEFEEFKKQRASWLEPYTLYRLMVREHEGNARWNDWLPDVRSFETAAEWLLRHPRRSELDQIRDRFAYIQWVAWRQWTAVKKHADEQGVRLLGELTFGVSANGCDAWANPRLFDMEWSMGTRPLAHFDTNKDSEVWGQNWGLPAYRWENHRSTGFEWLRGRVEWEREFFHGCRLDHLRGYFRAYMFPWSGGVRHVEFSHLTPEEAAARTGGRLPRFVPGPDEDPFSASMNELQGREIISQLISAADNRLDFVAELMGDMPDYMRNTMDEMELANLRFPQLERNPDGSIHSPKEFRELGLACYANHDNAPLASLYLQLRAKAAADPASKEAVDFKALLAFAGVTGEPPAELDGSLLAGLQGALFQTACRLAVLMCSDALGVPLRFNLPGSYGKGTWSDRLDQPLAALATHPVYGPRLEQITELIATTERGKLRKGSTGKPAKAAVQETPTAVT